MIIRIDRTDNFPYPHGSGLITFMSKHRPRLSGQVQRVTFSPEPQPMLNPQQHGKLRAHLLSAPSPWHQLHDLTGGTVQTCFSLLLLRSEVSCQVDESPTSNVTNSQHHHVAMDLLLRWFLRPLQRLLLVATRRQSVAFGSGIRQSSRLPPRRAQRFGTH